MNALGRHILVDLYDCDADLLDDLDYVAQHTERAARAAGATILNATFHPFSPHGVTGVLAIQESHLAIHTWPEYRFAAVDLFTCGEGIDPWKAHKVIKEALKAGHDAAVEMPRGHAGLLDVPNPT